MRRPGSDTIKRRGVQLILIQHKQWYPSGASSANCTHLFLWLLWLISYLREAEAYLGLHISYCSVCSNEMSKTEKEIFICLYLWGNFPPGGGHRWSFSISPCSGRKHQIKLINRLLPLCDTLIDWMTNAESGNEGVGYGSLVHMIMVPGTPTFLSSWLLNNPEDWKLKALDVRDQRCTPLDVVYHCWRDHWRDWAHPCKYSLEDPPELHDFWNVYFLAAEHKLVAALEVTKLFWETEGLGIW